MHAIVSSLTSVAERAVNLVKNATHQKAAIYSEWLKRMTLQSSQLSNDFARIYAPSSATSWDTKRQQGHDHC